MFSDHKENDL